MYQYGTTSSSHIIHVWKKKNNGYNRPQKIIYKLYTVSEYIMYRIIYAYIRVYQNNPRFKIIDI